MEQIQYQYEQWLQQNASKLRTVVLFEERVRLAKKSWNFLSSPQKLNLCPVAKDTLEQDCIGVNGSEFTDVLAAKALLSAALGQTDQACEFFIAYSLPHTDESTSQINRFIASIIRLYAEADYRNTVNCDLIALQSVARLYARAANGSTKRIRKQSIRALKHLLSRNVLRPLSGEFLQMMCLLDKYGPGQMLSPMVEN